MEKEVACGAAGRALPSLPLPPFPTILPCCPRCAEHYHLLQPMPVDLIAGTADGIIAPSDVYSHYLRLKEVGGWVGG